MKKFGAHVITDYTKEFNDIVKSFRHDDVLIGIPESEAARKAAENGETNNAQILFTNEFGDPSKNIPARPVMALGIRKADKEIAEQFKIAAQNIFSKGFKALDIYYNRAGIIASNSIKKVINSQEGIAEPSEATLRARRAKGFKGTKALLVTGQMRNAITYVVKGGK